MTITPVPLRPAASGSSGSPGRPDRTSGDPEGFAALVSQETDRLAGCACDSAASGDVAVSAGTDGGTADTSTGVVPAGAAPAAVVLPEATGVAGTTGAGLLVHADGDQGATGRQACPATEASDATPVAVQETPPAMAAGGATAEPAVPGPGVPTPPSRSDSHGPERDNSAVPGPGDHRLGAGAVEGGTGALDVPDAGAPTSVPGTGTSASATPTATGQDVAGAVAAGSTGMAGAETAGTAHADTGRTTTGSLVDQVSPPLTRLVTRGDGEHRMALKIHPADLGEVHLTVTVRGDRVDVEIAASAEARELLRDGLTQLRALLDPTGRGGGQLVFRDLPTAPTAGHSVSAEAGTGGDQGSRSGSAGADGSAENHDGRGAQAGHHAVRTSPGEPAARTQTPPRAGGPGTRTVDLTI